MVSQRNIRFEAVCPLFSKIHREMEIEWLLRLKWPFPTILHVRTAKILHFARAAL